MRSHRRKFLAVAVRLLPAAYFLLIAAFAVLNYRDFASELPQFLRYVFFPGTIGLLLAGGVLLLPDGHGRQLSWSAIAVLCGLFLFEAVMTIRVLNVLMGSFGAGEASALATAGSPDGLPPGYTAKRLNRALGNNQLRNSVLSGVPHSQVLLCWDGDKPVLYRADRYGFNNPDDIYERPIEVAVIGDSFVEGICQPPGGDITSQLRDSIAASVSLATRGSGPLSELAVLGRFGKALRPRHVVIAFFEGNDWENLEGELRDPWLVEALSANADYGPAQMPDDMLAEVKATIAHVRSKMFTPAEILMRTRFVRNFFALSQTAIQLGLAYPKASHDVPEFEKVLLRAKELAAGWGGDVTLVYVPQNARYIGALPHGFVQDRLRFKVLEAAARTGVEVIDLVELLSKEDDPQNFYGRDAHFSERGAAFTANAIATKLNPRSSALYQ